jgi:hypothetical protein
MSAAKVVMVTGGSGLVGKAIQEVIEAEKNVDEKWIYLSSKVSFVFASSVVVRTQARTIDELAVVGNQKSAPLAPQPVRG